VVPLLVLAANASCLANHVVAVAVLSHNLFVAMAWYVAAVTVLFMIPVLVVVATTVVLLMPNEPSYSLEGHHGLYLCKLGPGYTQGFFYDKYVMHKYAKQE
jgi:hypothetical protein